MELTVSHQSLIPSASKEDVCKKQVPSAGSFFPKASDCNSQRQPRFPLYGESVLSSLQEAGFAADSLSFLLGRNISSSPLLKIFFFSLLKNA